MAVGVAFADSSIVVIALPRMLGDFDSTIPAVAWVVTAYNLAVALLAFALVPVVGRLSATLITRVGLLLFTLACAGCALAPDLAWLIAGRCVQGVGAALLLAGAVPLLVAIAGSTGSGTRIWGVAAVVGAALGPALGGVLTQLADWRAIFIAQIPLAAAALLATGPLGRVATATHAPDGSPATERARVRWGAAGSLGALSGALVGALFLAVVLVIDGWDNSPLLAALIVSTLPLAAIGGEVVARSASLSVAVAGGSLIMAGALVAMALTLPRDPLYLAVTLALCGFGTGLAMPPLTRLTLVGPVPARAGSRSVGVRHAGLVVGLLLIAPLLAHQLSAVSERAIAVGAAHVIDAPLPLTTKIALADALQVTVASTPPGAVPRLDDAVTVGSSDDGPQEAAARARLGETLQGLVAPAVTRAFRDAFLLCALLGVLALVPVPLLRGARP
ncbi:MAG TPA: MFS transporter [Miltoncostaeaceae bacterium]|nr:MFS transporter [Miltoncostaeaceae bacterium]